MRISDWISDVCSSDLRIDAAPDAPRLLGYGEASDAHHMSTPHPQGLGAELALNDALARAGLDPAQVGHPNLNGPASQKHDEATGRAYGTESGCQDVYVSVADSTITKNKRNKSQ